MDVFTQYNNLLNSLLDIKWIIIIAIATVAFMIVSSIVKYRIYVGIVKKSVKDAIKEINAEQNKNFDNKYKDSTPIESQTTNSTNKDIEKDTTIK